LESKNIKTILIINDKIIDIDILVELLGEKYDVIVALDEKSALDTLEFEEISAIILDSSMQNIDISKLYGNIARRGIPILFIMDGLNENLLQEFSNIDLNGQITKPFHIDKIERSLKLSLRNK
jgi:PleD family two-component response regulator